MQNFKARIEEERKRELALLALQKNVSVRARHAKLRCIFRWIQDSQYANQSEKETNRQYFVKFPQQPAKFIKDYTVENHEREKEPESNKMITLVKPKLRSQFQQETDKEQGIVNRNRRKMIASYEARLKMLEDASLKHEVKLNEVFVAQKSLRKDLFTKAKQPGGFEKKTKTNKKKEGYDKKIQANGTENIYENLDLLTATKQDAKQEHTTVNQTTAEELTCSYNEKIWKTKKSKRAQTEKEKIQRHALKNLNQEVKEIQELYEENVGQNQESVNKLRDVRRGDPKPAHLQQVAGGMNSERDFRIEMKEEKREQMRRTKSLEKEVANLELQCKLNEHKIFRLEEHVNKLEDRIEKKDSFIEQLLYKKYKTSGMKGLLGCS